MPLVTLNEAVSEFILNEYDRAEKNHVDDCTHRNIFDIFNDHACGPCKCGNPECPGRDPENYCQPHYWVAGDMKFADGVEVIFDDSGLPLVENPNPELPWDEMIGNG